MSTTDPGWYRDPTGRFSSRYWNGRQWTNQASSGGANVTDEPPSDMVFVPPAPGTESVPASTAPPVQITQQAPRSAVGTVIAAVLGIIAVIVVLMVFANQSGDDGNTSPPPSEPTPTTQAPPADTSGDG